MKLFITSQEREALARRTDPTSRLTLAWVLRQMDAERSTALFAACCRDGELPAAPGWQDLAQAESAAFHDDLDAAAQGINRARALFTALGEAHALAMCTWFDTHITAVRGDVLGAETKLRALIDRFYALGDTEMADLARLDLAARLQPGDPASSHALLNAVRPVADGPVRATHDLVSGSGYATTGQHVPAIRHLLPAFERLLDCGMRYRAVVCSPMLAFCFSALGDPAQAQDWAQRGLGLSEPGWVHRNSTCQLEIATALFEQRQAGRARQICETLLQQLAPRPYSRAMQQTLQLLGRLDVTEQRWGPATRHFKALLWAARRTSFVDMQLGALHGLAACAQGQGRLSRARRLVQLGLSIDRRNNFPVQRQDLLMRAADIDVEAGMPVRALALIESAEQLKLPMTRLGSDQSWLRLAARAHEQLGQWREALDCERRAGTAERAELARAWEQRLHVQQALDDLQAMREQNERLKAQHLAAAERAAAAEQGVQTLERLAGIGLGLTSRLSREELFPLVDRELRRLLPVDVVMVFQRRGARLELLYGRADGEELALEPIPLDDPQALTARCAREDRLLCLQGEQVATRIPGVAATHSLLFAPLRSPGGVVGVLSLQAQAADAYGAREQHLVLSLAAYMAIALQNAQTYERLAALQHELAERRRLGALGHLVAGVAHELNTPLGNGLLTVGTLQAHVELLQAQLHQGAPRRSQLLACADDLRTGLNLMEQGLKRAANLVRDFKQLAVGPESEPTSPLDLPSLCEQLLRSESRALAAAGLRITTDLAPHEPIVTRHHALIEVLRALLDNVRVHAKATELLLRGRSELGGYRIDCVDNGVGIHVRPASRVFEPFFSTRLGQGGSGLGLSVALHRARALLGGDISVHSRPGEGCRFQLQLPPMAPAGSAARD